jgi:glc operon protein GlcG
MADTVAALKLTCEGAMKLLNAAMAKAGAMGVPQCISVVDAGGHLWPSRAWTGPSRFRSTPH